MVSLAFQKIVNTLFRISRCLSKLQEAMRMSSRNGKNISSKGLRRDPVEENVCVLAAKYACSFSWQGNFNSAMEAKVDDGSCRVYFGSWFFSRSLSFSNSNSGCSNLVNRPPISAKYILTDFVEPRVRAPSLSYIRTSQSLGKYSVFRAATSSSHIRNPCRSRGSPH